MLTFIILSAFVLEVLKISAGGTPKRSWSFLLSLPLR